MFYTQLLSHEVPFSCMSILYVTWFLKKRAVYPYDRVAYEESQEESQKEGQEES